MKTSWTRNAGVLFLIAAAFAAVSLWSTSAFLRKNDQAVILAGAHDWARGERQDWSRYYQFDKTYVLYAYCAAVFRVQRVVGADRDPVLLANRAVASAFWLALFVFIARYRDSLSPLVLFAVLAAPAILLNTQYVNSSTLSSAFFLLAVAALPRALPAAFFLFLAVGARADIVLLLPLLGWLVFQRLKNQTANSSNDWKKTAHFFQRLEKPVDWVSNDWKLPIAMVVAAVLALLVGRIWSDATGIALAPFFNVKMAAGYLIFGFGAAGLLFLWVLVPLVLRGRTMWGVAGLLAFLLPFVFFLPQLHAPRYFWRACEALLILSALVPLVWPRVVRYAVWAAAIFPLLVGLSLPALNHVRISNHNPTLFPSGDGHYPMGAYLSFVHRFRHAVDIPIDHNQRVWAAVRSADLGDAERFEFLFTPMFGYFMLEASLRGVTAEWRRYDELEGRPFFMDSRTLMRYDVKFPLAAKDEILERDIEVVSRDVEGIAVLRVGSGDNSWGARTRMLNRLFAGNEYRVTTADQPIPPDRTAYWFAVVPFDGAERDEESGWHYSRVPVVGREYGLAYSALPAWMRVQAFSP